MPDETRLKTFLEIPYEELEKLNLEAKALQFTSTPEALEKKYRDYLSKEKQLKAVTLCFTDIEGRFHMLDYDKKYLLDSAGNLTFDGSSIRGFSAQSESDLWLSIDWGSIVWLPSDVFGPGKVALFADVLDKDRTPYAADFRGRLKAYLEMLKKKQGITAFASAEIEGFLMDGVDAEQEYKKNGGFSLVSTGGYYHSRPLDRLRQFIDAAAEAERAMGFQNEKDHPEVAPSQFELNFSYTNALRACDQIQLYKLEASSVKNGPYRDLPPQAGRGCERERYARELLARQGGQERLLQKRRQRGPFRACVGFHFKSAQPCFGDMPRIQLEREQLPAS